MIKQLNYIVTLAFLLLVAAGCKKEKTVIPPTFSHFDFVNSGEFYVTPDPNRTFKIPLGLTTPSDVDRTIEITISSPTGAREGQQFTVNKKSFTIPAGKVTDSIIVKGVYNGLTSGKVDTVVFKISGGTASPMASETEYKLYIQQFCAVDINNFNGVFTAQDYYEGAPDGGPYEVYITPGAITGATTGTIFIDGIYTVPVTTTIKLDWTDVGHFTTEMTPGPWFNSSQVGLVSIRPNGKGTFSSCNKTFRIEWEASYSGGAFKITTIITP